MPKVATRSLAGVALLVVFVFALGSPARGLADPNATRAEAFRLSSPTSGIADVAHVSLSSSSTAGEVMVGIYSNARGRPWRLLSAGSESGARVRARTWSAVPVTPIRLARGRTYWLAVLGEGGPVRGGGVRRGPCVSSVSVQTGLRGLPRRWSAGGMRKRAHCPIAAYLLAGIAGGSVGVLDPPAHAPGETAAPSDPPVPAPGPSPAGNPPGEGGGPQAPANTVAPAISGPVIVGERLVASPGTWTGDPASYSYQWQSCNALGEGCLNVSGATSSSYTLTPSDLQSTVRVVVTASNAAGSAVASSPVTGPVLPTAPGSETPPAISGVAEVGATLEASPGGWSGSPTAYAYEWQDCNAAGEECTAIAGARTASYRLSASDVGHRVVVVVTASNAAGSTPAVSSPTAIVAAELQAPSSEAPPLISGSALVGDKLSASNGTWTGHPTSYAYQWQICDSSGSECSEISEATSATYVLIASDAGHTMRVVVTASNASGSTPASSEVTAVVVAQAPAAPADKTPPAIGGTAVEGQTLTASPGTWSGNPTSYAYQWQDCNAAGGECAEIAGATSSSRKLAKGDVGHTLRVVVRATNAGGTGKATSAQTATVLPPAPANTASPAIDGATVEGETLSASTGTWTESPTSYAYQWEDCNAAGEGCANVNGATAASYVLSASDVGHRLRVAVTASNAGGHNSATSAATSVVTVKASSTPENCFENPETEGSARFEACGYPGPKNTGVAETSGRTECSGLPEYTGSKSIGTAKATIEGKEIKIDLGSGDGGLDVNAPDVTFNKDCLLISGGGNPDGGNEGPAIDQEEDAPGLVFENSTIRAEGSKLPYTYEKAVDNSHGISAGWKIENSRVEDCGECVSGFGELDKSYVISNEYIGEESHGLHREDWYLNDESAVVKASTIFNPSDQTSDVFMDSNNGAGGIACDDKLTIEDSLLAGGGTSIEMCGKNDTDGSSSFTFVGNRIARCLTKPIVKNSGGEEDCSGPYFEGADAHGYMPNGGADGVAAFEDTGDVTWSGNYWDDDLGVLAKP